MYRYINIVKPMHAFSDATLHTVWIIGQEPAHSIRTHPQKNQSKFPHDDVTFQWNNTEKNFPTTRSY